MTCQAMGFLGKELAESFAIPSLSPVLLWFWWPRRDPVVLGRGLGRGLRTTSHIQLTKADTCVYTSGVLRSPHQSPEKETRPWARFLHTRGPPESA